MEKRALMTVAVVATMCWASQVLAQETGGGTAGAGTAPAPAATTEPAPAQPATTATPASPTEASGEKAKGSKEKKEEEFVRPFAGTSIYWENSFSAISLDKEYDYTWNPVYEMGFGVRPVWAVTKSVSLSTDIGFSTELTNSDFSKEKHEVFFNDIPLNVRYRYRADINEDVNFNTGLKGGLLIPTSKMSQYTTLYTALSLGTKVGFTFPNVASGLSLSWDPSFKKYFHESATPKPEDNLLLDIPPSEQQTSEQFQALAFSDGENPSWSIANGLNLSLNIVDQLTFAFGYAHTYIYTYAVSDVTTTDAESCRTTPKGCEDARNTGHNERGVYMQSFTYGLDYTPWDVLTFSIGAITSSNQLGPDGQYRTPFFNRATMLTFGVSLDLDAMISSIEGSSDQETTNDRPGNDATIQ
ncbi:MAG: hypothetical protein PHU25_07645 [Deltaproteobacteria bacterium]|nr:hypothetical protein [Deltaproteobacteria bacterium]